MGHIEGRGDAREQILAQQSGFKSLHTCDVIAPINIHMAVGLRISVVLLGAGGKSVRPVAQPAGVE
jgi:hypothetical protein